MFQFSIRTLFIVTTVIAVIVWILFVPPGWVGLLALLVVYLLLPAANLAGLIYHSGAWRAFFIGTAPPVVFTSWYVAAYAGRWYWPRANMEAVELKLIMLAMLALIFISGLVAVGIRWWAIRINEVRT